MTNILNQALNKQPSFNQQKKPAFILDSEGKIKPMEDKGRLLPSKIFDSPSEYAKDLKKDIVNIKKAANGKANDHELGRINDVAIKLGSLGIAGYLCAKNPLKLNKAMQFVGFGSFFAAMALFPKLFIQAPLRARTGVDIHQKYIDSQNRKKKLFQDPQYDLTDLYSREDLDRIGKKLKVDENLPDRDNFIKQRAKKTATQGNTLWMLAAGSSPIFSALMCNVLEKGVNKTIEKGTMTYADYNLTKKFNPFTFPSRLVENFSKKSIEKLVKLHEKENQTKNLPKAKTPFEHFIQKNAEQRITPDVAKYISKILTKKTTNSATIEKEIENAILSSGQPEILTMGFVKNSLKGHINEEIFKNLSQAQKDTINNYLAKGEMKGIADILAKESSAKKPQQMKLAKQFFEILKTAKKNEDMTTISNLKQALYKLNVGMIDFRRDKKILDGYISSRVGEKSGTYIANQWNRFTTSALKGLKLSSKELKALSRGDISVLDKKLTEIATNEQAYSNIVKDLMLHIDDYEKVTGKHFTDTVANKSKEICENLSKIFRTEGFEDAANKITKKTVNKAGTLENEINENVKTRILGAKSSFYRFMQALDIYKRANNNNQLQNEIFKILKQESQTIPDEELKSSAKKLVEVCKKAVINATTTDQVEKFTTSGYELSRTEYKALMKVLYGEDSLKTIKNVITNSNKTSGIIKQLKEVKNSDGSANTVKEFFKIMKNKIKDLTNIRAIKVKNHTINLNESSRILSNCDAYKKEANEKLANWAGGITTELQHRVVNDKTFSANAVERNALTGKPLKDMIQEAAKQSYNSKTWLKIWGGAFAAIAGITLIAGLFIGRKGETEKEIEAQSKKNG